MTGAPRTEPTGTSGSAVNERYLGAALAWLRLRLMRHAPGAPGAAAPNERRWRGLFRRGAPLGTPALTEGGPRTLEQAARELDDAAAGEPLPALPLLAERFGLSRFEREVLLLCVAMELDTRIGALCARIHDDPQRPWPSFALAMALFDEPAWEALSPERPLRAWRLIEVDRGAGLPLTASLLVADERVVNFAKGLNHLDGRLAPLLTPIHPAAPEPLPPSHAEQVDALLARLQRIPREGLPAFQLLGAATGSKRELATHAAGRAGLVLYRLPGDALPAAPAELDALARLWHRESLLLPVALYLDASDASPGADPAGGGAAGGEMQRAARFLERSAGLFFVDVSEPWPDLPADLVSIDVSRPTAAEQAALWRTLLPEPGTAPGADPADPTAGDPRLASQLAGQFDLDAAVIDAVARDAAAGAGESDQQLGRRLWDACLRRTRPRLDQLAQRLEPRVAWKDLVLPDEPLDLLRCIAAQVHARGTVYDAWGFRDKLTRGLGVTALFAGESGTGKTLAAEVLAHELRLHLYRIDLSAVVSKYIGETEKNLRRLFDAADQGGAILFFDEADALFGKRSEVKDSHDRYANIEINYLLQRMESYRGLAILATNMRGALDSAFLRRLRFVVEFPFPAADQRSAIWRRAFPADAPLDGVDFDGLADLNLTGGSIQVVAVNAAFLAASRGSPVRMEHLLVAVRSEFRKLEKPINEALFRRAEVGS